MGIIRKMKYAVLNRTLNRAFARILKEKDMSWKTTMLGIATLVVTLGSAAVALLDGNPETGLEIETLIVQITAAIGLIAARDNNKTSEAVGAK